MPLSLLGIAALARRLFWISQARRIYARVDAPTRCVWDVGGGQDLYDEAEPKPGVTARELAALSGMDPSDLLMPNPSTIRSGKYLLPRSESGYAAVGRPSEYSFGGALVLLGGWDCMLNHWACACDRWATSTQIRGMILAQ